MNRSLHLLLALSLAAPAAARASSDPGATVELGGALAAAAVAAAARASPEEEAAAAGVPATLAREVAARAAERGVDAAAALEPVAAAARSGVPPELVATKVLEGLAKGASPERVLAVARALSARLEAARALLDEAVAAGLVLRGARVAALADLAGALAEGVAPEPIRAVVAAAQQAGAGADAAVAAARTLGELARRGVPVPEAQPLAEALAARPPLPAGEVAALFDAYRAERGRASRAFLEEATRRTRSGAPLAGMIDWFGDTRDGVVRLKDRPDTAGSGAAAGASAQRGGRGPSTPPGLEERPRGHGNPRPK